MPLKRQMQEVGARDCHKSTDWLRGPHRDLLEQVPKKRSDDSFHIDALQAQKQAPQHAFTSIAQRDNTKPSQKLDGEFWRADCLESTIDQDVQHWLCAQKRSDDSFHIDALQAQKQAPQHAFTSIAQRSKLKSRRPSMRLQALLSATTQSRPKS